MECSATVMHDSGPVAVCLSHVRAILPACDPDTFCRCCSMWGKSLFQWKSFQMGLYSFKNNNNSFNNLSFLMIYQRFSKNLFYPSLLAWRKRPTGRLSSRNCPCFSTLTLCAWNWWNATKKLRLHHITVRVQQICSLKKSGICSVEVNRAEITRIVWALPQPIFINKIPKTLFQFSWIKPSLALVVQLVHSDKQICTSTVLYRSCCLKTSINYAWLKIDYKASMSNCQLKLALEAFLCLSSLP